MYLSQLFSFAEPLLFPDRNSENLVICVSGIGSRSGFSALITDCVPNYDTLEKAQCFPLYIFDGVEEDGGEDNEQATFLEDTVKSSGVGLRKDAITVPGLAHFQRAYPGENLGREDVFYYVYAMLHSPDYRSQFSENLSKEVPRIPCVASASDFWLFSQAGRELSALHLDYEKVALYPVKIECSVANPTAADYRVEQMKYGKKGKEKDLTTLRYNNKITLKEIPLQAYNYGVGGTPALDWVVERQRVKTDKDSGFVSDANSYAIETVGNPRYPLELFQRIITVSLETMRIVDSLPKLDVA